MSERANFKKRKDLSRCAKRIIAFCKGNLAVPIVPILRHSFLRRLVDAGQEYKDILNPALKRLIDVGLLSSLQRGNFSLEARLFPGMHLGPVLEDEGKAKYNLYFTLGRDCEIYGSHQRDISKVVQHDVECQVLGWEAWPSVIVKLFRAETRGHLFDDTAKESYDQARWILKNLIEKGVLQKGEKGARVVHERQIFIRIRDPLELDVSYSFGSKEYAEGFIEGFPPEIRQRLKVA